MRCNFYKGYVRPEKEPKTCNPFVCNRGIILYRDALRSLFFAFLILCISHVDVLATTYTWKVGSGVYTVAGNWTPSRTTPATSDALIFPITATITGVPIETVTSITVQSSATVTLQGATAGNTLTLSNATNALVVNSSCTLAIGTNLTIVFSGTFTNNGFINGPGTMQIKGSVNIPSGSGSGYFSSTSGSILNVIVGDGTTTNTVTSSATDSVTNLTVSKGAILAINSGLTMTEQGDLVCNGTIQDGTGSSTLSIPSLNTAINISGGSSSTHGQINLSTLNVSGTGTAGTVSTNGKAVTWSSGSTFPTDGSWTGQIIELWMDPCGAVSTNGTSVTWLSGTQFVSGSGWLTSYTHENVVIGGGSYSIASVPDNTHMTLASSAGVQASATFECGYAIVILDTIASVTDATHLTLTTNAGTTASGSPWGYGVATPININSSAYLDFGSSTLVKSNQQNQTLTNNGTVKFNSQFAPNTFQAFLTYNWQRFINSSTGSVTILGPLNIGWTCIVQNNGSWSCTQINTLNYVFGIFINTNTATTNGGDINLLAQGSYVNNSGTLNCGSGTINITGSWQAYLTNSGTVNCGVINDQNYTSPIYYNSSPTTWLMGLTNAAGGVINCTSISVGVPGSSAAMVGNSGTIHCTGSAGIVGSIWPSVDTSEWINYAGSWLDVAGPFFETAGKVVCNSATNTVKYDGTGTQIIYPTQYNNLIIAKSASSNNGTLTNGNDSINGMLTFTSGNMNAIASGNTVIVTSTGSVSGASQGTGWVNGNLQMPIPAGSATTNFYIGDSAIYAPINLAMSGASASSIISYTRPTNSPNDPSPGYPSGIEQNHHVYRYWRMINNGVTFTSYNPTYNFANPSDVVGNPAADYTQYVVRTYDPTTWYVTTVGTRTAASTQATGLTSFGSPYSDFEIGIDSFIPLPISLLSFSAKAEDSYVLLNWITASEINNDYFTVEKTADATNFSTVGTVAGAGTSTIERNYSLIDRSPYPGVSYYRLKQTDYDGKFTYSGLEAVDFNKSGSGEVTIFPNPSSDKIYFGTSQTDHSVFMLHIYDMKGSEAIVPDSITFSDANLLSVDISTLAKGVYTIQLISDNSLQLEKFVKQ